MDQKKEILKVLEQNARLSTEDIACQLGLEEGFVVESIQEFEKAGIISGYKAMVDWNKVGVQVISALIEVRVTPQRESGFGRIAQRIYEFPQVKGCYLMSGGYDLKVDVEGESLHDVASFVSDHISTLEHVISTRTHFVMVKYKESGITFKEDLDPREVIIL